jgi:hypothetical protein
MTTTISSRTPEGAPNRCPVCAKALKIEPSTPPGDAPCPHCGHLLWFPGKDVGPALVVDCDGHLLLDEHRVDQLCAPILRPLEMPVVELREGFDPRSRDRPLWMVLDLHEVEYITSGALGRLITLWRFLKRSGGRLSFRNVGPAAGEILGMGGRLTANLRPVGPAKHLNAPLRSRL